MRLRFLPILFFFVLPVVGSFAQTKSQLIAFGDEFFKKEDYATASYFYLKIIDASAGGLDNDKTHPYDIGIWNKPLKKDKADSTAPKTPGDTTQKKAPVQAAPTEDDDNTQYQYVVHQLAESYRRNYNYKEAEIWYEKASKQTSRQFPNDKYWYGVVLMTNHKYPKASEQFEAYLNEKPEGDTSYVFKRAKKGLASCYFAQDTNSLKKEIIVTKLDTVINAGSSAFAPGYNGDSESLLFSAARNESTVKDPKRQKGIYYADLYTTTKNGTTFDKPKKMESTINTPMNEGSGFVAFGRTNLFFTRWDPTDKNNCSIWVSKNLNDKWLPATKLGPNVNMEGYKSQNPALSADGTVLYFSSNRPGGQGKMDLWFCTIDEDGNCGVPKNLGKTINTTEDEVTPFVHYGTNTLFFSSNGHNGFGGLDIFKSQYSYEDSVWSTPKNVEMPINSPRDDSYFIMDRTQQHGYFSSDRDTCMNCGSSNGHCPKIYTFSNEPLVFDIQGVVYDANTNLPVSSALITFKDVKGEQESFIAITDEAGHYSSPLTANQDLFMKAQKNKFFGDAANVSTSGLTESKHFIQDFFLNRIPPGEITIPGIEYDFDKATLRPRSMQILDSLAKFLELNDNIDVQIAAHTDQRGSDTYNLKLSQERAKSCVDYLISKGIKASRLEAVGYGETKPLIEESVIKKMPNKDDQDAAYQKNRRTTFFPVKEGVIQDHWRGKRQ
jgi:OOP family OmpA-OmpF porin